MDVGPPQVHSILEFLQFTIFISKLVIRTIIYVRNVLS